MDLEQLTFIYEENDSPNEEKLFSNEKKAFLDTIAVAEGTAGTGNYNGYDVLFGYRRIRDWNALYKKTHGGSNWRVKFSDSTTSAAGRYQIQENVWKEFSQKINGGKKQSEPFNMLNQDKIALLLVDRRVKIGKKEEFKDGVKYDELIKKDYFDKVYNELPKEWASFNPSIKTSDYLYSIYKKALDLYQNS